MSEPFIETYTGRHFHFMEPDASEVDIADIAYALAHTTRWGGHCSPAITVAQHCVFVARMLRNKACSPMVQLQGLLHDAPEAYIPDIPSPLKPFLNNFSEIDHWIERAIFEAFGVEYPLDPLVKLMDEECLRWEYRDLMRGKSLPAPHGYRSTLRVWNAQESEKEFLGTFFSLIEALPAKAA